MNVGAAAVMAAERLPWPDPILRAGVTALVGRTKQRLAMLSPSLEEEFAFGMVDYPVAINTKEANEQHYELPPKFFTQMLGPQRKYSCCYYDDRHTSLAEAEERALAETAAHAGLADGQRILELGCGWGSLSLWMARNYPGAHIVSVSNSQSQRSFIERLAMEEGLRNLSVITADINGFSPFGRFDRVVSVEMFEHMSNWHGLLRRVVSWMAPGGALFVHVFAHRCAPYRFNADDPADWIARHFFTGGIMPSRGLIRQFGGLVEVENEWWWNGRHYQRTAEDWLRNFDANRAAIDPILRDLYGRDAGLWRRRWRLFLHATAGLFGHSDGEEWGVGHYRLVPARRSSAP